MNTNLIRIRSGIETAKEGSKELLKALNNDKIINSPESIRIAIEDYFKILDEVIEQAKILHEISTSSKDVQKQEVKSLVSYVKGAYERGIDISYQTLDFLKLIVEKAIFAKEKEQKNYDDVPEKYLKEIKEKPVKEVLSPSIIKKNIQLKHILISDTFFILKFLDKKEQDLKEIKYEIIIQQGQTETDRSTTEIETGVGYVEQFAKGN